MQQTLRDFGVAPPLAPSLGFLLLVAELLVAVTLLPAGTAWWGAAGGCALLLLFLAGTGMALARGRQPNCHCFGQLSSAPIGWSTLGRNMVLAMGAAFVVWKGPKQVGPSLIGWVADLTSVEAAGITIGVSVLGVLALEGWLLVHLLRQNGRLLLRIEALEAPTGTRGIMLVPHQNGAAAQSDLPVGAPAPAFSLATLGGETLTLDTLCAPGKPVMLIFSDPGCAPCNALMPEIGQWERDHAAGLTIALVSRGTPDANRASSVEKGPTHVLFQDDREVADAYQVYGTPSAVIVGPDGMIGSPVAAGPAAIRTLVAQAIGRSIPRASSRMQSFEHRSRVQQFGAVLLSAVVVAAGGDAARGEVAGFVPSEVHTQVFQHMAQSFARISESRPGRHQQSTRRCSRKVQAEIATLCEKSLIHLGHQASGAETLVCMPTPEAWNGDLILFAPGATRFPENDCKLAGITGQLDFGVSLPRFANQLGFGFATSSCSEDVLALRKCKEDLGELAANFQDHLDALASQNNGVNYGAFRGRIFLVGASIGGLVATQLIEGEAGMNQFAAQGRSGDQFVGALAVCSPIGSFEKLVRYQGDLLVLTDCLYRDELIQELGARGFVQGGFLEARNGLIYANEAQKLVVPEGIRDALDEGLCPALEAIIDADPDKAAKLLRIMNASEPVATDPSDGHTVGKIVAEILCSDILPAISVFDDRFGGNPYGNLERFYFDPQSSSVENDELNQCVDRFAADTDTRDFETSGQIAEPMVTLHTLLDPRVPFMQDTLYNVKVLLSEQQAGYTRIPSSNFGHCAFDAEEAAAAFAVLFFRVSGFELPGVEEVFEKPEALARFHELVGQFLGD